MFFSWWTLSFVHKLRGEIQFAGDSGRSYIGPSRRQNPNVRFTAHGRPCWFVPIEFVRQSVQTGLEISGYWHHIDFQHRRWQSRYQIFPIVLLLWRYDICGIEELRSGNVLFWGGCIDAGAGHVAHYAGILSQIHTHFTDIAWENCASTEVFVTGNQSIYETIEPSILWFGNGLCNRTERRGTQCHIQKPRCLFTWYKYGSGQTGVCFKFKYRCRKR